MKFVATKEWVEAQWPTLLSRRRITPSGCWVYTGPCGYGGYGLYTKTLGLGKRHMAMKTPHRMAAILELGMRDDRKIYVSHLCNNPPCFNPTHLHVGTQKDNMAYAAKCGRTSRGECKGNAVLTSKHVKEIRIFLRHGISQQKLADLYGVSRSSVESVAHGKSWGWVK